MNAGRPDYVYVASSWRNSVQPGVVSALRAHGIDCYDFKNPAPGDSGFSWKQVTPANTEVTVICEHCGRPVVYSTFANLGAWEPDYDPARDPECWRHVNGGYAAFSLDPSGSRIGFSARGSLLRSAFGIAFGIPSPGSTVGVSDAVEIIIEAEFTRPAA